MAYFMPAPPRLNNEVVVMFMRLEMPVAIAASVYRWSFMWRRTDTLGRIREHFRPRGGRVGGRDGLGA